MERGGDATGDRTSTPGDMGIAAEAGVRTHGEVSYILEGHLSRVCAGDGQRRY